MTALPDRVEIAGGQTLARRLAALRQWFKPDSGDETVNFADRDGKWTVLTFLDDVEAALRARKD